MRDQRPPSGGAVVAGAPARRVQARGPMSPPGPTNAPAPIVQKRVIKKPIEGKEGESSEGQNGENASSDDLWVGLPQPFSFSQSQAEPSTTRAETVPADGDHANDSMASSREQVLSVLNL